MGYFRNIASSREFILGLQCACTNKKLKHAGINIPILRDLKKIIVFSVYHDLTVYKKTPSLQLVAQHLSGCG